MGEILQDVPLTHWHEELVSDREVVDQLERFWDSWVDFAEKAGRLEMEISLLVRLEVKALGLDAVSIPDATSYVLINLLGSGELNQLNAEPAVGQDVTEQLKRIGVSITSHPDVEKLLPEVKSKRDVLARRTRELGKMLDRRTSSQRLTAGPGQGGAPPSPVA